MRARTRTAMQTTDLQRAAFYGASGDGQDSAGRENRRCVFPETGIEKCRGAVTLRAAEPPRGRWRPSRHSANIVVAGSANAPKVTGMMSRRGGEIVGCEAYIA